MAKVLFITSFFASLYYLFFRVSYFVAFFFFFFRPIEIVRGHHGKLEWNATQWDSSITLESFYGVVDSRSICQHWETSDDAVRIYEPTKRIHFMWKVLLFRVSGQNIIRNYASTTTHSGLFVSTPKSRQNVPAERETTTVKNPIKTTLFGYNNYRFMSAIKNLCILNSARSSLRKKIASMQMRGFRSSKVLKFA